MTYEDKYKPLYEETKANLLEKGYDKFVELTELWYEEFKEKNGTVTCEGSTKGVDLDLKMKFLALMSMIDPTSIGYWRVYWCDTCAGHSEEHPYHHELMMNR